MNAVPDAAPIFEARGLSKHFRGLTALYIGPTYTDVIGFGLLVLVLVSRPAESFERVYQLFPRLKERRTQIAGSMSGGEQQMCAIARALMAAPKLLVVDEMSLGLAPVVVDQLLGVLSEIRKQGITVLLVEQDVFAAFSVADRGYLMETGQIVREGRVSELSVDPEVQRAYLGVH